MEYKKFNDELKIYRKKVLKLFNIKKDEYIEFHFKIKDFYSYSINIRNDINKPNLIFIHGYGGNSILYVNFFKYLMNNFNIYSLDLPGVGMSSVQIDKDLENVYTSEKQCLEYIIDYIKKWIDLLNLKEYFLMGHSFGAYLINHFANIYPIGIKEIYLFSPGGFNKAFEDERKNLENFIKDKNFITRYLILKISDEIFIKKEYPYKYFSKFLRFFVVRKYFKNLGLSKKHSYLLYKINNIIVDFKGIGHSCLGYIFNYGMRSNLPICEIYESLLKKFRIYFYYGKEDWMDKNHTINFCRKNNLNINFRIISNANHQVTLKNPLELYHNFCQDYNLFNKQ